MIAPKLYKFIALDSTEMIIDEDDAFGSGYELRFRGRLIERLKVFAKKHGVDHKGQAKQFTGENGITVKIVPL